ncbi:hypothetical protein IVB45_17635 [Bradyrhizobium sp. 4]|nr:hypothetical protein [Bradyrhizobium sp. 39]MCK1751278.1 hypothetical protein [Bradyrhizobium sp. 135]UPJ38798.1 hypothetical protein IVB45_17635 [Bradyrhizobium sp. 4]
MDVFARHQVLYEEIARSHPSLLEGKVYCARCGKSRHIEAAKCLREGWPKCCGVTVELKAAPL